MALLKDWVFTIWIKSIGLSIIFGIFVGFAANRLLRNSQFNDLIDKQSFLAFSLELSVKKTHQNSNSDNYFYSVINYDGDEFGGM